MHGWRGCVWIDRRRLIEGGWSIEDGGWSIEDGGWSIEDGGWSKSKIKIKSKIQKIVVRVMRSEVAAPMHTARAVLFSFLFGLRSAAGWRLAPRRARAAPPLSREGV
jgi:hypothetical protein